MLYTQHLTMEKKLLLSNAGRTWRFGSLQRIDKICGKFLQTVCRLKIKVRTVCACTCIDAVWTCLPEIPKCICLNLPIVSQCFVPGGGGSPAAAQLQSDRLWGAEETRGTAPTRGQWVKMSFQYETAICKRFVNASHWLNLAQLYLGRMVTSPDGRDEVS